MDNLTKELLEILSYRRPADSNTEREVINKYIRPLPNIEQDAFGNLYTKVGEDTTIMFSCHTDTVHHCAGKQKVLYYEDLDMVEKPQQGDGADKQCLGADDGVGIWIMRNMILAGVPGLYIFHREEECGGFGSDFIATNETVLLQGIKAAVAFDRRGTGDIITHQAGFRCASDTFAWALSEQLGYHGLKMHPSDRGIFTDTAHYTDIIPECTNLSVGYEHEHTQSEMLDVGFARALLEACIDVNWEELPIEREPDPYDYSFDDPIEQVERYHHSSGQSKYLYDVLDEPMDFDSLYKICKDYPETVAELLLDFQVSYGEMEEAHRKVMKFFN